MATTNVPQAPEAGAFSNVIDLAERRAARDLRRTPELTEESSVIERKIVDLNDACIGMIRGLRAEGQVLKLSTVVWLLNVSDDAARELFDSGSIPGAFRAKGTWRIRGGALSKFVSDFSKGRIDPETSFRLHDARVDVLMRRLWPERYENPGNGAA
jgi:hypothetical protein